MKFDKMLELPKSYAEINVSVEDNPNYDPLIYLDIASEGAFDDIYINLTIEEAKRFQKYLTEAINVATINESMKGDL